MDITLLDDDGEDGEKVSADIILINDGEMTTLYTLPGSEPVMTAAAEIMTALGIDWDATPVGAVPMCPDDFKKFKALLSRAGWAVVARAREEGIDVCG